MSAEEVEHLFFPPENLRRKDDSVMPDYQMVYDRLTAPGSKANLFYLWLKYKKECPSGYQYTQYCLHFKRFVEKNYGSEAVSMVVELGSPVRKSISIGSATSRKYLWIRSPVNLRKYTSLSRLLA